MNCGCIKNNCDFCVLVQTYLTTYLTSRASERMATGCERSVLLMAVALSLFCILGVCTGLTLDLNRVGQDSNTIILTCRNTFSVSVPNAVFYMRAPGIDSRMLATGSSLMGFMRNGGEITFTLTPGTEAIFSCASNATRTDETSGVLLAGGKSSSEEYFVSILYCCIFSLQHNETPIVCFHLKLNLCYVEKLLNWIVTFSRAKQPAYTPYSGRVPCPLA